MFNHVQKRVLFSGNAAVTAAVRLRDGVLCAEMLFGVCRAAVSGFWAGAFSP
ncbi:hypothetical protein BSBH6_00907 [Bacillus subtilis]|nr:hypothetical protein BSBH6_00907 [Bacillus subtilis]RPK27268.1 hypothetical protein BH5_00904 [Bacillus subtilis]